MTEKEVFQRSLSKALDFASYKPRTQYEVTRKIKSYLEKFDSLDTSSREEILDEVLIELNTLEILSDEKYAERYLYEQFSSNKPKSPLEVKAFLYKKGINNSIIDQTLESYTIENQVNSIKKLSTKKKRETNKLKSYLINKGFAYEAVLIALDTI